MKKVCLFLSCLGVFAQFQACKVPTSNYRAAELSSIIISTPLKSGTPISLAPIKSPLIKQINTGTSINFKTTQDIVVDGKTVIKANSMALGSISKIQPKGSYNADIVTIKMEYVTAADGQIIALTSKDINIKVNLHDVNAPLFSNNFSASALVANDNYIRF